MTAAPTLVWFRQDLRLTDNPALAAAVEDGAPIVPVYVLDDETPGRWAPGGAARWWLHQSLAALAGGLDRAGARLVLRRGRGEEVIPALAEEIGAARVVWNRCYEPWAIDRDTRLKAALKERGLRADSFNASLLFEPWAVLTRSGDPYKVYTPFWKACRDRADIDAPKPAPQRLPAPEAWPAGDALDDWELRPKTPDWANGLRETWRPGEAGAHDRLGAFLDARLGRYKDDRNRPDLDATSGLSPHLHWGEIGPRQVWSATGHRIDSGDLAGRENQAETFLKELVWREFSYHLLYHFPHLPDSPLNERFSEFPWAENRQRLRAWQTGRTGYPIVDAGMRQLWHIGWMHNRLRMIVASFLVKDLLQPWQAGEAWFWDTLVDADLANNSASWQWVAGCGAGAAPYFRVFNPVLQGRKFDPDGDYVRRWVPELRGLSADHIHEPWAAPAATLKDAGVRLGDTYPEPMIDHKAARREALSAFEQVKAA